MKLPTMKKVESSNIDSVGHGEGGLFVRFKGGGVYRYPHADASVYREMLDADSVGSFFASSIRGKFQHKKMDA